jgi:hypothetical protein
VSRIMPLRITQLLGCGSWETTLGMCPKICSDVEGRHPPSRQRNGDRHSHWHWRERLFLLLYFWAAVFNVKQHVEILEIGLGLPQDCGRGAYQRGRMAFSSPPSPSTSHDSEAVNMFITIAHSCDLRCFPSKPSVEVR